MLFGSYFSREPLVPLSIFLKNLKEPLVSFQFKYKFQFDRLPAQIPDLVLQNNKLKLDRCSSKLDPILPN